MANRYFTKDLLRFLRQLDRRNERAWFKANQARYEAEVREPAREFIRAIDPLLGKITPHLVANDAKVGGSLMRPQRDTRFAADKTPYKTNVGIQFRHAAGKDVHAPGMYLHIDPHQVFLGAGIWHPDNTTLGKIRRRIVDEPAGWKRASRGARFREVFDLAGDSLKRAPRGFDEEHPLIEDLKRKDHIAVCNLDEAAVIGPGFDKLVADHFRRAKSYMRYLCVAIDLEF